MKHIALISLHTPTATNFRGASALPYHILAFRPKDIQVEVWSFNLNGCTSEKIKETESALGLQIHVIQKAKWFRWLQPTPVRLILSKPVLSYLPLPRATFDEIASFLTSSNASLWIYGEDIAHVANKFKDVNAVITTPDCEAMYYYRVLAMKGIPLRKNLIARYALMYHRYAKMAASFPVSSNLKYHLVGKEDALFLHRLNPEADVRFFPHPHYDVTASSHQDVKNDEPIRLLIAGRYDFTMAQSVDEAVLALATLPAKIKSKFKITFLGKGWENSCKILQQNGFDVEQKGFVENYAAEVSSHHIQLTPIVVGTGTKGKVLDAFANGLLVIGTPFALENIAVKHGKECIEYSTSDELSSWMCSLANNPMLVNEMAHAGTKAVLTLHSREKIAEQFFSLFN